MPSILTTNKGEFENLARFFYPYHIIIIQHVKQGKKHSKRTKKVFFQRKTCGNDKFCTFAAEIWLSGR